jgi:hypothetical protein
MGSSAPCCREMGVNGLRGRPPLAFTHGPLAPAMAPILEEQYAREFGPPPFPPPPMGAAPPDVGPLPPAPPRYALNDVGNPQRGITRKEVEEAVADWCRTNKQAPLCQKLRTR